MTKDNNYILMDIDNVNLLEDYQSKILLKNTNRFN